MIAFTDRAAAKVRELLAAQPGGGAGLGLRVSVRPGGCAGYKYALAFTPAPEPGDEVLSGEGFDVFVDPQSARLLQGVRVDWVEGPQGSGFAFSFAADAGEETAEPDPELAARVEAVLAGVRPSLRADGGDVELVDVRGGTVRVRLAGACSGCSGAAETLAYLIEARLRAAVPGIERVVAV